MKKRILTTVAAAALLLALTACGGKNAADNTITVAASSTPHAEILEQCIPVLAEQGYTLEIKVMDDYIIPNTSTESGDENFAVPLVGSVWFGPAK